jgi:hypothetical protein
MTAAFENIVQHLFHQPSLHSVTVEELQRLVQQNPSFAAAQYLLLKKMQDTSHPDFNSQLKKTSLFFHNPLWLQFLLQPQQEKMASPAPNETVLHPQTDTSFSDTSSVDEQGKLVEKENNVQKVETISVESVAVSGTETEDFSITEAAYNHPTDAQPVEAISERDNANVINEADTIQAGSAAGINEAEVAITPDLTNEAPHEDVAHFSTISLAEAYHYETTTDQLENASVENEATATASPVTSAEHLESTPQLEEQTFTDTHLSGELTPAIIPQHTESMDEPPAEIAGEATPEASAEHMVTTPQLEEHVITDTLLSAELTPAFIPHHSENIEEHTAAATRELGQEIHEEPVSETSLAIDNSGTHPADEMPTVMTAENKEDVISDKPLLRPFLQQRSPQKDDLLFEPYHTIDYFASQGININKIEPEPTDRFGKQLKSFTEWLKGMKKLPQATVDTIMAENEESKVVAAAFHSVETKEIITETMAEVYDKQGLKEKAVDVYTKLSLQNPSKSAYFASKIEALKQ